MKKRVAPGVVAMLVSVGACLRTAVPVAASPRAAASLWDNCTDVHKRYPHRVGRVGAHDKTSGTPVTNFKRSNLLYRLAMRTNPRLDRDKDGIACEKR
jgi:hypothetical protein